MPTLEQLQKDKEDAKAALRAAIDGDRPEHIVNGLRDLFNDATRALEAATGKREQVVA